MSGPTSYKAIHDGIEAKVHGAWVVRTGTVPGSRLKNVDEWVRRQVPYDRTHYEYDTDGNLLRSWDEREWRDEMVLEPVLQHVPCDDPVFDIRFDDGGFIGDLPASGDGPQVGDRIHHVRFVHADTGKAWVWMMNPSRRRWEIRQKAPGGLNAGSIQDVAIEMLDRLELDARGTLRGRPRVMKPRPMGNGHTLVEGVVAGKDGPRAVVDLGAMGRHAFDMVVDTGAGKGDLVLLLVDTRLGAPGPTPLLATCPALWTQSAVSPDLEVGTHMAPPLLRRARRMAAAGLAGLTAGTGILASGLSDALAGIVAAAGVAASYQGVRFNSFHAGVLADARRDRDARNRLVEDARDLAAGWIWERIRKGF